MSEYWWRAYEGAVDHPKLCLLSDRAHRGWFNLLCVAAANDGVLPAMEVLTVKLRLPRKKIEAIIAELVNRALLDEVDGTLRPHNWDRRQFKSDVSTERVSRYREKRKAAGLPILGDYSRFRSILSERDGERCIYCEATGFLVVDHMVPIALGGTDHPDNLALACKPCNSGKAGRTPELAGMIVRVTSAVTALTRYRDTFTDVTVTKTPPDYRTQNTETEKKDTSLRSVGRSQATRPKQSEEQFEEFWKAYPKRDGANPKGPSRKAFFSFIKAGIDPGAIIAGARRCAEADRAKIGTEYIPQAIKWLRDRRWEDYPEVAEQQPENTFGWQPGMPTDAELRAKHGSENGSGKGEGIRPTSNGIHREPTENSEPGAEGSNLSGHKTGNSGVGSVGKILQRIPRF